MFEEMTRFQIAREINRRLLNVNGVEKGFEWNLREYVADCTTYKKMAKIKFINKFIMTFEVMKKLSEVFDGCELRVQTDEQNGRLVLVIRWE